jgi:outer membrane protein assembly factor BamB
MNHRKTGLLVTCVILFSAAGLLAQDWPQWRGPNRDNKVEGFTAPKVWPKTLTQKWSVPVGAGVSSPVLVGDKVYAFGRIGGDEVTTCLDAMSGKVVWQKKKSATAVGGAAQGYGGPRSTPAVAEGKIVTLGVNGTVTCMEAASGNIVWRKETGDAPRFATSTSPLLADGKCILFLSKLIAFDLSSGEIKWTGPGGTPYGSPVLMTVDGVKQVVTPTDSSLIGVGLSDGKALWQRELPGRGYTISYGTPIIDDQTVIYEAPIKGGGGSSIALKIDKNGDKFKATELWKSKCSYQYCTPVLRDGLLFGLSSDKKFLCMDAATGKVMWTDTTPRGEAGGVLNAGSVILALTGPAGGGKKGGGKKGGFGFRSETAKGDMELTAFEPSNSGYKELANYKLSAGTGLAYPIVAGNRVYAKGNTELTLWMME